MPNADDSGARKSRRDLPDPDVLSAEDAAPTAAPPEPVEDSADDPIPEKPEGTESDEELDLQDEAEERAAVDPPPAERAYRRRRLSDPTIAPRLRRRFTRKVPDTDFLADMIQNTFVRSMSAAEFPRENQPLFTWIYKPASASRKKQMRAWDRRKEELELDHVDRERWAPSPDGEGLSDLDAEREELLARAMKADATVREAVDGMVSEAVFGMSPAEVAAEEKISDAAYRKRKSRARMTLRSLGAAAGLTLTLLLVGATVAYVVLPDRPVAHENHPTMPHDPENEAQAKSKAAALATCAEGDAVECVRRLEAAKADYPALERDPEIQEAAAQATQRIQEQRDEAQRKLDDAKRNRPNEK
jgi:DNA-directed RNA polymerase specialized sigma24 family protein